MNQPSGERHPKMRRSSQPTKNERRGIAERAFEPNASLSYTKDAAQLRIHRLEARQADLELQNAELRIARDHAESVMTKYTELYDLAPVGFFTLANNGKIQLANLAFSALFGFERSELLGSPLTPLVSPKHRAGFRAFLKRVIAGDAPQSADFEMAGEWLPPRVMKIEAWRSAGSAECSATVVEVTERKRVEDQMRVSEIRYRRLFEAAHDGVLLLDPGTCKITDANPFMTALLGYPRDQLIGKELFEIGLLKDEAASRKMFRKLKRMHEVRYEDLPLESQGGRHQEVEVVASLHKESGNSVIQCNIRDITGRKQAEIASKLLAAIVESSDAAIIAEDISGLITNWNKGAENIFGYTAAEMLGSTIMRLVPEDRPDEESQILAKIMCGMSVEHFETTRRTKKGSLINVSVTVSPIKDANGKVIGVSKVARDISEQKKTEDVLLRNEALFSALVSQAPVGVYVVDARFRMQQANPMAMLVFKNVHPLVGRDFSGIMRVIWPRRVADQIIGHFRHTLETGEAYHSPHFVERRRNIEAKETYEWQTQRVILPAGEFGVVCFFNNITERTKAEATRRRLEALTSTNLKLKQEIGRRHLVESDLRASRHQQGRLLNQSHLQQKQLRELSHGVLLAQEEERKRISRELHDVIAQTLVGINVHLAALTRGAATDPASLQQQISQTHLLVEKAVDIVHDFARELRPTMLDDLGLIPALQTHMQGFMADTGIRVSLKAFAKIEKSPSAVRTVLYRVAQEALTNVARHAKASRVEVKIESLEGTIIMKIKDNGKGFVVGGRTRAKKSSRLGLLGMRERVEMIGGKFHVESGAGEPTTIHVEIPAASGVGISRGKGRLPKAIGR